VALFQVALGIMTVLAASPFWPSLLHQAGAAILWMTALVCGAGGMAVTRASLYITVLLSH
jgi:heme A synthase